MPHYGEDLISLTDPALNWLHGMSVNEGRARYFSRPENRRAIRILAKTALAMVRSVRRGRIRATGGDKTFRLRPASHGS